MDNEIEVRKERIKVWLTDRHNLMLLGILIFAFAIRIYYFVLTKNQPLWYDEAGYMAIANHWASGAPFDLGPQIQRLPLFQFLAAIILMVGLGEQTIRLLLVVIPSTVLVFTTYLLGKEMFDKKIGLIAAFFTSVSWTLLFWTERVQPDPISMVFQVLSIFLMWKYWKSPKTKLAVYSGIFAALGFHMKISGLLVPMIFMVFILLKDRFSALKNKDYYYFSLAFILTMIPYVIWSQLTFSTPLGFRTGYGVQSLPIAWYNFNFYYLLTENILFVLFIIGVLLASSFLLYLDVMIKDKKKVFNPDLFSVLTLAFISAFYIFWIRNTDDRWVFLWLPFIFFLAGRGLMFIYENVKKYQKGLALIIFVLLIVWVGYSQLNHTDNLIKIKKDSYGPVREAGIWLKENSAPGDDILSLSYTQTAYYSERNVLIYSQLNGSEEFDAFLEKNKPRFLQVSAFEYHPPWVLEWTQKNQNRLTPVQVYFADAQKQQPILIVYEVKYQ